MFGFRFPASTKKSLTPVRALTTELLVVARKLTRIGRIFWLEIKCLSNGTFTVGCDWNFQIGGGCKLASCRNSRLLNLIRDTTLKIILFDLSGNSTST